ncbi:hypothetical protein CEP52_010745 [Fusarium oligoseptatum]|uniref:Uncharacterized protein n=1 Tax=Fusarium oligoseptatum TaxID=2604345 RepID=A0A428T6V5_9HYPO|nr:hypothetical protein CEP52_010745 [Fusarium oligoseptatum]
MDTGKMLEPFIYDVSPVYERLIWGGAPAPGGHSAAATTAIENVSKLFPNDKPNLAPNSDNAKQQGTKNSSGKSRL